MAKPIKAIPLGCATERGYDPWFALCVARIRRAVADDDLDFFNSAMYDIMFAYCTLCVPGYFSRHVDVVLPKGIEL